jgi:hypothetical protein
MRTRELLFAASLAGLVGAGCASARVSTERSYVRPNLDKLKLETIDLVVVAAGPPRAAGVTMDVHGFDPPALDKALLAGGEDEATHVELARAVAERLGFAGYAVSLILRANPSSEALSVRSAPRTETSTSVATTNPEIATATSAPSLPPPRAPAAVPGLTGETTLADLLKKSTADAVLVVRVVPIDSFYVDLGTGTRTQVTELGRERIEDVRPAARQGRLLLGQAFLFDRETGLRLWTKQLPDYPEGGRLVPNHRFLQYGLMYEPNQSAAPPAERAAPAADRFTKAMFKDFPAAHPGSDEARRALAAVDVEQESEREQFLDRGHLSIDVGAAWGAENARLEGQLGGTAIPNLGTGAVAPAGIVRLVPRAFYLAPGGLALSLAFPVGYAPSGFSRSYERDNPTLNAADPNDRAATVKVSSTTTFGAVATIGSARFWTPTILYIPNVGLYGDVFSAKASPASVIGSPTHTRIGAQGGLDVLIRTENTPFYGRLAGNLKLGLDLGGPLTYGIELVASAGLFL